MGHVIAVSGKGGVGKTTLCGLLIQYLCESGKCPVLAVDADANANLNEVLGVEPEITLGELREEIERAGVDPRYQIPTGITKQAYLEMRLSDAIAEEDDYDLRPLVSLDCNIKIDTSNKNKDGKTPDTAWDIKLY